MDSIDIISIKNKIEYMYDELLSNTLKENNISIIEKALNFIRSGKIRAAEKKEGKWIVNSWVKKAILLAFSVLKSVPQEYDSFDKFSLLKFKGSYRKIPGAIIRDYVHISDGAVIMPSCINIGAYIGNNSMIDINSVIGSCAQIGANCHISAHACIGGVLEPLVALPVIIEDNCFIGAHSAILEGVTVKENAIIGAGTIISASTKIIDRETMKIINGFVPENAVVVPGSYPSGNLNINCAVIIKYIDKCTDRKSTINNILRK